MKIIINIPNTLTLLRIAIAPVLVYFILEKDPIFQYIALFLFLLASLTDFVDGYYARKYNQKTDFGAFLDPLADKALVFGALITFLSLTEQIQIWMVLCIVGRDMLITALRYLAIRKGTTLKTSIFGKFKTAFQMISVIVVMLSIVMISYKERATINFVYVDSKEFYGFGSMMVAFNNFKLFLNDPYHDIFYNLASFVPYFVMFITTWLTIISGLRYIYTNYKLLLPPYNLLNRNNLKQKQ